jgi:hypothetical protein
VRCPARTVEFVTVKRNGFELGRSYGHWWVELDATESYGWWPSICPVRFRHVIAGIPGVLNGVGVHPDGTATRDPYHGTVADHEFHPVLVAGLDDDEVRHRIRTFSGEFAGDWKWSTRPTENCRTFQLALLAHAGLVDGTGNFHTRGEGCPVLAPLRRAALAFTTRRRWPRNLPAPTSAAEQAQQAMARPPRGWPDTTAAEVA